MLRADELRLYYNSGVFLLASVLEFLVELNEPVQQLLFAGELAGELVNFPL